LKIIIVTKKGFANAGFSLVEMLVVIAIIGVIAAIAIPNIGEINQGSKIAVAQRRAQDIAALFAAGRAAEVPSFLAAENVREAMDAVGIGDYGMGVFSGSKFIIEGVSGNEDDALPVAQRAGYYLRWTGSGVTYEKSGGVMN